MEPLNQWLDTLPPRLHRIPYRWAERSPHAVALSEGGRLWSYAELVEAVQQARDLLQGLGVRPGDRVMLVSENTQALVVLIFAVSELDAWSVIVNARLSPREIDVIRDHCQARRLFYTTAVSKDAAAHAERHGAEIRPLGRLGEIGIGPLNKSCEPETVYADPGQQVAALIYTSGTTGTPKGVMLTHRNLLFIAAMSSQGRQLTPADRVYGVLPISHVYGLASVFLGTLYAGACLHLVPRYSAEDLAKTMAEGGITVMQGVPAMYARLLELAKRGGAKLTAPQLRFIYAGGSPLDPRLKAEVEALFGLTLHNGYGMTESSPTISQTRIDQPRSDCSVGPPIPGVEVRIVDSEGRDVPPGEVGELWVRGPNVMKGYYRNPELTASVINSDGWLNTGDLARQDPDDSLFIVGRSKELIIRSGFNVYPVEVETVLNAHPAVTHSAVVGREVEGNEEVVAFVELTPGSTVTAKELDAFLMERLSPYKRPSEIIILPALPAAATGKILKNQLKQMAQDLGDKIKAGNAAPSPEARLDIQ